MFALFGTMLVLAAIPSSSVLIVVSRSAASGFIHGACVALGIVCGDIFFILIAILGLSLLAESMGELFVLVRYIGGTYLLWMGVSLWRSGNGITKADELVETSMLSSFMSGLLFTLADQKAILFYLGLLPAFVNLSSLTMIDTTAIILIALVAVGGVKIVYAYMAKRAVSLFSTRMRAGLNIMAGGLMVAIGLYVLLTA
jgi:threonine/homoserine/homoserine lactone efflux protein